MTAELLDSEPEDILLANIAYDVTSCLMGCSTFAAPTPRGPLHARNLDWEFSGDLLRKHTTVFTFPSRHGDYLVVTWPDDGGYKTQHQVVMEPRAGRLTVRAPGRRKEIYEGGKR